MRQAVTETVFRDALIGPVRVSASEEGLCGVAFTHPAETVEPSAAVDGFDADGPAGRHLASVLEQLDEYFAGVRREFDVRLDWSGSTGWRQLVLRTLYSTVGHGETVSYRELAERAGRPEAARAVGGIMASNPIPIVVPCHRVVSADGGLGGFAGSGGGMVELKRKLLELEGSAAPTLFDL